jgi:hypothetical protein
MTATGAAAVNAGEARTTEAISNCQFDQHWQPALRLQFVDQLRALLGIQDEAIGTPEKRLCR